MNKLEELEEEAFQQGVTVLEYRFDSDRIKGLYCDGTVALNKNLTPVEKTCILAEEIAHHNLNVGDITDQKSVSNRKQEHKARMNAYDRLIGLSGIVSAYKAGCHDIYTMAEHLDVSEAFLTEALDAYRAKYGERTVFDRYIIYFEPQLGIFELF